SAVPEPRRYPPATPGDERTSYPRSRSRSTSLRTVRVVTPSRSASSGPDQEGRVGSSASRRSRRIEVSSTRPSCPTLRNRTFRMTSYGRRVGPAGARRTARVHARQDEGDEHAAWDGDAEPVGGRPGGRVRVVRGGP